MGLVVTSLRPGAVVGAGLGGSAWRTVLSDPAFRDALVFTAQIAAVSTVLACGLGLACAAVLRHAAGMVRAAAAVAVPVPHLVVAALAVAWLGPGGLADRVLHGLPLHVVGDRRGLGIVIVYLVKEVPFLTVLAVAAWDEPTIAREEAAAALGAGPVRRFVDVVLPRLAVPVIAGGLVVAAFVIGATEVPLVVGPTRPDTLATYSLTAVRLGGPAARAEAAAALCATAALALGLGIVAARGWQRDRRW